MKFWVNRKLSTLNTVSDKSYIIPFIDTFMPINDWFPVVFSNSYKTVNH